MTRRLSVSDDTQMWFVGKLSRTDAERALAGHATGTFIMRESDRNPVSIGLYGVEKRSGLGYPSIFVGLDLLSFLSSLSPLSSHLIDDRLPIQGRYVICVVFNSCVEHIEVTRRDQHSYQLADNSPAFQTLPVSREADTKSWS